MQSAYAMVDFTLNGNLSHDQAFGNADMFNIMYKYGESPT